MRENTQMATDCLGIGIRGSDEELLNGTDLIVHDRGQNGDPSS